MTTIERLRELEKAVNRHSKSTIASAIDEHAYDEAVRAALPAMLAVIEAAEKAEKFIGSLKRWECSTGLESDAFPLHQELRNTLAAFREVRE